MKNNSNIRAYLITVLSPLRWAPALWLVTTVDIAAGKYLFTATGSKEVFDGFTIVYKEEGGEEKSNAIPPLRGSSALELVRLNPSSAFYQAACEVFRQLFD